MNDYSTIEGCIRQSTDNPLNTRSGDVQLEFDFSNEFTSLNRNPLPESFLSYVMFHAGENALPTYELFVEYLNQRYGKKYGKNKD